jgi:Helix-hairpin-helix motif
VDIAWGGVEDVAALAGGRTFLLLERHRGELRARLEQRVRLTRRAQARRRYEDLCLASKLTRVQRDSLSDSSQLVPDDDRASSEAGFPSPVADAGLPEWAAAWGRGCLFGLESELNRYRLDLRRTGKWLFPGARSSADARAEHRLYEILASVAVQLRSEGISPPGETPRSGGAGRVSLASALTELNEATYERLRSLGLSVTQVRRVLAHRERSGGFRSVDDLDEIPGFPRALLEELKQALTD